jgi:hypothetical protein
VQYASNKDQAVEGQHTAFEAISSRHTVAECVHVFYTQKHGIDVYTRKVSAILKLWCIHTNEAVQLTRAAKARWSKSLLSARPTLEQGCMGSNVSVYRQERRLFFAMMMGSNPIDEIQGSSFWRAAQRFESHR